MSAQRRRKVEREGRCRLCPRTEELTKHHLVSQQWFKLNPDKPGKDSVHNIVPLCVYCHRVIDGSIGAKDKRREKRRMLRARLSQDEVDFVLRSAGAAWLDHHYPVRTITHGRRRAPRVSSPVT